MQQRNPSPITPGHKRRLNGAALLAGRPGYKRGIQQRNLAIVVRRGEFIGGDIVRLDHCKPVAELPKNWVIV